MSTTKLRVEQLSAHTTLRVGGPATHWVEASTEAEIIEAVRAADRAGEPVLMLGGGSNLLVGDQGFDGTVVAVTSRGITAEVSGCFGAEVTVAAGEPWDDLVAHTVAQGWSGLEALSGIPGLTGATPIQNVGAYGAEVAHTLAVVHTWDRETGARARFAAADCRFGYRTSRFKQQPGRYVVLSVTFQLPLADLSAPVRYAQLADTLGVAVGKRVPAAEVRAAVLALRRSKGMVLDADDPDTWSAGSFFTNPVLTADRAELLPPEAPRFPQPDGSVKTSAAWLIEHAGFGRGYGMPPATLSTKHTLALTNRGGARAADLLTLARCVRTGVADAFGVTLEPEPVLVGCAL
ncbi:UDP-N-acetylmuramate dehydrogenase [Friedmanniella endophytica]|uniref:UDP-N-acetylenolpyruvoylglucosamine reductase n=1 Tax=Microlunatus kandeliicorticis TaxID=1759536 RepID=A0A7W3IPW3_9ACTN|nr:UDP-N-acetylmuramate dehydrogenase [Microlunatus kandeliicorticis]MBA8793045.1 UDP-N-acetylmuramate dehydrogenase [Microlunatus kandeliicorticis]